MAMLLEESQQMLLDMARSFISEQGGVAQLRALRDSNDPIGFSPELWAQFGEMGFNGILLAEQDGGSGLGHVETGLILEQIGRNLTASPFLSTAIGGAIALSGAGEALRAQWLPRILNGEAVVAIAIDEAVRHRPDAVALKAEAVDGAYRLTGFKSFVPHGHVAALLIVAARTGDDPGDPDAIRLFAVDTTLAGVTAAPVRYVDSHLYADIAFTGVKVAADAIIGNSRAGHNALDTLLDALSLASAAELLGVALEAFDRTVDYLKERRQFGVTIGSFQALQHRAALLYCELEVARAAVFKAQQLLDADDAGASEAISVAKATTDLVATLAVQEAIQLHGGIGMTDELDIGLFMKRAKVLGSLYGNADYHAERLARRRGY